MPKTKDYHRMCSHGRRHHRCVECMGAQICEHRKDRRGCKACKGTAICNHGVNKAVCRECGGVEVWARILGANAKRRAKAEGLPYAISQSWIVARLQEGCPVFRLPFILTHSKGGFDLSASIDKFDAAQGYTEENSFVLSTLANRIKNSATAMQVKRVAEWMQEVLDGKLKL